MPLILPGNSGSATAATGFNVANSLRFAGAARDTYLTATFGSAPTLATKNTISLWFKRSTLDTLQQLYAANGNTANIIVNSNNTIAFYTNSGQLLGPRLYRDTSAWMHFVYTFDSTQGTAANRFKVYINGVEETSFNNTAYPGLNVASELGVNGTLMEIGTRSNHDRIFEGYMAETAFVDGQALDATSFGEFDEDSGIWKPIDVSGLTFGTNGFYLDFEDSSALGNDAAGSNNFTVNNLTAIDQSTDTCTNNFATWNNLLGIQIPDTFSESNLVLTMGQNAWRTTFSTIAASSGKFYAEVKWVTGSEFTAGFGNAQSYSVDQDLNDLVADPGGDGYVSVIYKNGALYENGSNTSTGYSTYSSGDIIMLAMDLDNYKLYLGVNGTWGKSGDPANNSNGVAIPSANQGDFFNFAVSTYGNTQVSGNFGSPAFAISSGNADGNGFGNFEYAVPSGYLSLCTNNLNSI